MKLATSLVLASILLPGLSAQGLAPVFGDHMVLQRESQAPVWGRAADDARVTVKGSWPGAIERTTQADSDGAWRVVVETPAAGGPYSLTVRAGSEERVVDDILIGEVWLCSGQSNMEWSVRSANDAAAEIAAADHSSIRFFDVPHTTSRSPQESCGGTWRVCSPKTIPGFSAVGYFFGRELQTELGVPIGLIGSNWGGTVAEAWTSEETLRAGFPEFGNKLDRIARERANPQTAGDLAERQDQWWKKLEATDSGVRGRWMEAGHDAAEWGEATVPGTWSAIKLGKFDGCLWYRRTAEVPEDWLGKDLWLELGPIDDMDLTWFNGALVGETRSAGRHNTPRRYRVPADAVIAGANVIAVCAVDTGGVGRLGNDTATMRLRPADQDDAPSISLAGTWRYRRGSAIGDLGGFPTTPVFHENMTTALYNGMIAPLVPFAIRGAIWYQGESNRGRPAQYRRLFPAMIGDWRARWGRGDFPFYFVQIAPYAYGGDDGKVAELREAQAMALSVPNTGMAVTMDIGNPRDIHPTNKQDVGLRLALCALAQTYGKDVAWRGPMYRDMVVEGAAVRLNFDYAQRLTTGDAAPTCFTIAGEDQVFHPATAVIDGAAVVVRSDNVKTPVAVRFAWGEADQPNLENGAGLPAPPFRTDDWAATASPGR